MHVEVDQSGKIGSKGPTALAFSNDVDYKILIPAMVKRRCIKTLRRAGKSGKVFYLQLFSIALFLLLKDHVNQLSLVTIDSEYKSKDKDIKAFLLNLFQKAKLAVNPDKIEFSRIGKRASAHKKANDCFNGRIEPDRVVTPGELLAQFKIK